MLQNALHWNMILEDEIKVASVLIRRGLAEIQLIGPGNDVWFLPLFLCSSGLERVLKCMHVVGKLIVDKRVPETKEMKDVSHSLNKLLDQFLEKYFIDKGLPALIEDRKLLSNNHDVRVIFQLLSEFGNGGRYHNIDYLTRSKGDSDSSAESRLRQHIYSWIGEDKKTLSSMLEPAQADQLLSDSRRRLVILLERVMRALARQFTMGGLAPEGRSFVLYIRNYLDLWENSFGTVDYSALKRF